MGYVTITFDPSQIYILQIRGPIVVTLPPEGPLQPVHDRFQGLSYTQLAELLTARHKAAKVEIDTINELNADFLAGRLDKHMNKKGNYRLGLEETDGKAQATD